jgi:hypothetical protein
LRFDFSYVNRMRPQRVDLKSLAFPLTNCESINIFDEFMKSRRSVTGQDRLVKNVFKT